jgi:hypothetical protein
LPPTLLASGSAVPRTTRLYTQGVQAAVRPSGEADAAGAFGDVSTQTLASAIDQNLNDMQGAEPSALTIADPELIQLADELTTAALARARLVKLARLVAPALICSGITAAVCWFAWGRNAPPTTVTMASMPTAAAAPAPAPVAAPPAEPPVAAATAAPAPAPAPAPTAAVPAPASGRHCRARITSRPSGATVMLGDRRLGTTPLDSGEVDCASTFTLSRPRYNTATAQLSDAKDGGEALLVKLNRPPAELALSSSPAGAQFKVNRASAGQAPRTVPVSRYERVSIEATLAGHRKWQKTLYVTAATTKIEAVLKPAR